MMTLDEMMRDHHAMLLRREAAVDADAERNAAEAARDAAEAFEFYAPLLNAFRAIRLARESGDSGLKWSAQNAVNEAVREMNKSGVEMTPDAVFRLFAFWRV